MNTQDRLILSIRKLSTLFENSNAMEKKWEYCGKTKREDIQTDCGVDPCFCYITQLNWGEFFNSLVRGYEYPFFGHGIGNLKIDDNAKNLIVYNLVNSWRLKETNESLLSEETLRLIDIVLKDGIVENVRSMQDFEKMFAPELDSAVTDQLTADIRGLTVDSESERMSL